MAVFRARTTEDFASTRGKNVWYRVAYLPRKGMVVSILHCFKKQGRKTPKPAVKTIEERFKAAKDIDEKREGKGKGETMRTKGDVFDAISPPAQAIVVKFKANLYEAILKVAEKYKPSELEIILHEPHPRVSELLNTKLGQKSLEKLLAYAGRLGIEHRGSFSQVHRNAPKKRTGAGACIDRILVGAL